MKNVNKHKTYFWEHLLYWDLLWLGSCYVLYLVTSLWTLLGSWGTYRTMTTWDVPLKVMKKSLRVTSSLYLFFLIMMQKALFYHTHNYMKFYPIPKPNAARAMDHKLQSLQSWPYIITSTFSRVFVIKMEIGHRHIIFNV